MLLLQYKFKLKDCQMENMMHKSYDKKEWGNVVEVGRVYIKQDIAMDFYDYEILIISALKL